MSGPPEPEELESALKQYAIYERPIDYPEGYVVREWLITAGEALPGHSWRAATLEEARAQLPEGVSKLPDFGDPNALEVWM